MGAASVGLEAGVVVELLGSGGLSPPVKDGDVPKHVDVVSDDRRWLCAARLFACLENLLEVPVHPDDAVLKHCDPVRSWIATAVPDDLRFPALGADPRDHIQRVVDPVDVSSFPVQSEAAWSDDPGRD